VAAVVSMRPREAVVALIEGGSIDGIWLEKRYDAYDLVVVGRTVAGVLFEDRCKPGLENPAAIAKQVMLSQVAWKVVEYVLGRFDREQQYTFRYQRRDERTRWTVPQCKAPTPHSVAQMQPPTIRFRCRGGVRRQGELF